MRKNSDGGLVLFFSSFFNIRDNLFLPPFLPLSLHPSLYCSTLQYKSLSMSSPVASFFLFFLFSFLF